MVKLNLAGLYLCLIPIGFGLTGCEGIPNDPGASGHGSSPSILHTAAKNQARYSNSHNVFFDVDSNVLSNSERSTLHEIGTLAAKDPAISLEIIGHADERGSAEHNLELSTRRAQTVALVLTDEYGIEANRMAIIGAGEALPTAFGRTESDWAQNRRVQIGATLLSNSQKPRSIFETNRLSQDKLLEFRKQEGLGGTQGSHSAKERGNKLDPFEAVEPEKTPVAIPSDDPQSPPCLDDESCEPLGRSISSGTGFFITPNLILTNEHVIRDSEELFVVVDGSLFAVNVVNSNREDDLAILTTALNGTPLPLASVTPRKGSEIAVLGFPSIGLLGNEMKATFGHINSLSGLQGNPKQIQFDAPIQPGNSGSPVLSRGGQVVGVATSSLNQEHAILAIGVLAQAVNYAVKIANAQPLGPLVTYLPPSKKDLSPADLVEKSERSIVLILNYFKPGSTIQETRKKKIADSGSGSGSGSKQPSASNSKPGPRHFIYIGKPNE